MHRSFADEKELIIALQVGKEYAYTYLFETYYQSLCIYCASLTKNDALAEDIVQSVFVKLWDNKALLQIDTSLKNYLYKATYNGFINEHHRLKRKQTFLDELYLSALHKTIEQDKPLLKQKLALLDKAIAALPKKSKEVFLLNKKEGYTYDEIAVFLNVSKNTVENHMGNALKKLRKSLRQMKKAGIYFLSFITRPQSTSKNKISSLTKSKISTN